MTHGKKDKPSAFVTPTHVPNTDSSVEDLQSIGTPAGIILEIRRRLGADKKKPAGDQAHAEPAAAKPEEKKPEVKKENDAAPAKEQPDGETKDGQTEKKKAA